MERGNEDIFKFSYVEHIGEIANIELWRDTNDENDKWFCEYILVTHVHSHHGACTAEGNTLPFPSHRWIISGRKYDLFVFNYCLPQLDTLLTRKQQRKEEIAEAKIMYKYESEMTGFPRRVSLLNFSFFKSQVQFRIFL